MSDMKRPLWVWGATIVAVLFGALTIKSGGAVLFVDGPARQAAGNYVPLVLWFNFLAGFAYIIAGIGLWSGKAWAPPLALVIALLTITVFVVFGISILFGLEYEMRTVIAMALRSVVWVGIAAMAYRLGHRRTGPLAR